MHHYCKAESAYDEADARAAARLAELATTTFGKLENYIAANDNRQGGQYIGLTRHLGDIPGENRRCDGWGEAITPQQQHHRDYLESVEAWRTSPDRTIGGLRALEKLDGYIYLGSPYSKCADLDKAARDVAEAAGTLMNMGHVIYCPIAHGHAISQAEPLPQEWDFWKRQCDPMIDAAAALIILTMDGWQESVGLNYEIASFLTANKPMLYLSPEELSVGEGRVVA